MLPDPTPAALLTRWTPQPVAIVVAVALAVVYAGQVRRSVAWPRRYSALFGLGLLVLVWTSCGFLQVYGSAIYWVWVTQTLTLWLAVPILLLAGRPVQLARAAGRSQRLDGFLASPFAKVVANPLVGPALVPILSAVLFFGPLPGWAIATPAVGWVLQVLLVLVGGLMVLPLMGLDGVSSSLAVGLSLAIGSFELVLDALPGIVLRLHTTIATGWFAHRDVYAWSPHELRDQQVAGAIVWCIAEVIDLPFLYLVFRRWLRADARDAAEIDAVLEAERAARRGSRPGPDDVEDAPARTEPVPDRDAGSDRDVPWWESDPAMQQRLHRHR